MLSRLFCWLLTGCIGAGLLAGCVSQANHRTLQDIVFYYGGEVQLQPRRQFTSAPGWLSGRYLIITLRSPGTVPRYGDARVPASNCALLAFSNLAPDNQNRYDYYRVSVAEADTTRTYTFTPAQLAQATRARTLALSLLDNLQQHNYLSAVNACNAATYGPLPPDSLLARFRRLPRQLRPFNTYAAQGFQLDTVRLAGKRLPLVRVVLSVPRYHVEEPPGLLALQINPRMKPTEKFLYGATVLR